MADERRRLVLVVEDEEGVRRPLTKFLKMHGFEVVSADTVDDALDAIQAARPAAAIVDLRLRRGSGRDVVVSLPPMVPAIIFSAFPDQSCDLEHLRPNTRLVAKPFSLAMLVETLREMLEGAADQSADLGRQ